MAVKLAFSTNRALRPAGVNRRHPIVRDRERMPLVPVLAAKPKPVCGWSVDPCSGRLVCGWHLDVPSTDVQQAHGDEPWPSSSSRAFARRSAAARAVAA